MQPVKWQRNAIFKAVEEGGLDPKECSFDYDEAGGRVTHLASGSYFLLEGDPGHYMATAVVGENPAWPYECYTWGNVDERIRRWAEEVSEDVDTPDLWAELQREPEILPGAQYDDVENTPFSSSDQADIADQVRQIKEFVRNTYSLTEAQMRSLEATLDNIEAAAGRIGRKDWLLLVYGSMFSVIVTGLLPPGAVQTILQMALRGLAHLFDIGVSRPSSRLRRSLAAPACQSL
jgi:hypothetical protein